MYIANCVDQYGHLYTNKGLLERYDGEEWASREFQNLDAAIEYGHSFIKTYPHAICEILQDNEIVESINDEAYWRWKDKNTEAWRKTHSKMNQLYYVMFGILFCLLGMLIAVVSHYLTDVSLRYTIVIYPILLVISAYTFKKIFVRVC